MYDAIILLLTIALIHYGITFYYGLFKKIRAFFNKRSEITITSQSQSSFVVKEPGDELKKRGENIYE